MTHGLFNFRHVCHKVGIPSTNENNWAVGNMLSSIASKAGAETHRILAEKTDPAASVSAPHVIAHYPMEIYEEACAKVAEWWGDRQKQLNLI